MSDFVVGKKGLSKGIRTRRQVSAGYIRFSELRYAASQEVMEALKKGDMKSANLAATELDALEEFDFRAQIERASWKII